VLRDPMNFSSKTQRYRGITLKRLSTGRAVDRVIPDRRFIQ